VPTVPSFCANDSPPPNGCARGSHSCLLAMTLLIEGAWEPMVDLVFVIVGGVSKLEYTTAGWWTGGSWYSGEETPSAWVVRFLCCQNPEMKFNRLRQLVDRFGNISVRSFCEFVGLLTEAYLMEDMERLAGPVHGSEELQDVLSTHQLNSGCYPVVLKRGTANLVLHMMLGEAGPLQLLE
jgi:hypothetical protein